MAPAKPKVPGKIWRISKQAPMGEWIYTKAPAADELVESLPEVSYGTWVTSSYDLLDGADVIDEPDTIPAELLDELFAPKAKPPEGKGN